MGTPRETTGSDPSAAEAAVGAVGADAGAVAEAGATDTPTQAAAATVVASARMARGLRRRPGVAPGTDPGDADCSSGSLKLERERVLVRLTAHSSLCSGAGERKLAARAYRG
ncbi:hypothetical protein GCM10027091_46920 [Streptomyces daliensis]